MKMLTMNPLEFPPPRTFWPIMVFALTFPSLATWIYFVVLSGSPAMGPVYTLTKILQFSLPVVVVLFLFKKQLKMFNRGRGGVIGGILFGIAVGLSILALYLGYLRHSEVFATFDASLREKLQGLGATTPLRYAALAVFISLFHSFLEEYYWRWFVFGELRKHTAKWIAYAVSSIGFAAHHIIVVAAYTGWDQWVWITFFSVGVAVGGLVWAYQYEKSGSLIAPWISHLIVDVALMAVGAIHLWG